VRVNGAPVRKSYVPDAGDVIEAEIPAAAPTALEPEDLPLEIVHEDEHLVVVDKPAGLVVHPAPTDEAHRALSDALSRRQVRRGYVAAAWGGLEMEDDGLTIDRPIGRDPNDRKKMAVVEGGRPAVTHVRRIESWRSAELLAIRLETGRTHQVRVHLRSLGHPVVCDPIYAPGWERGFLGAGGRWAEALARRAQRLFLHAAHLAFEHPLTGEDLSFRADLPEPLASAVDWARQSGHADSQSPAGQSR
jgi:23S rRNA pseudouridine1911/1915/1917 synthase